MGFFKNEVGKEDWKMWDLVHDRYIKFYRGSLSLRL